MRDRAAPSRSSRPSNGSPGNCRRAIARSADGRAVRRAEPAHAVGAEPRGPASRAVRRAVRAPSTSAPDRRRTRLACPRATSTTASWSRRPKASTLDLVLAGLGSRFIAASPRHARSSSRSFWHSRFGGSSLTGSASGCVIAARRSCSFLVMFAYDVPFEMLGGGRTPGRRALGIRVVGRGRRTGRLRHERGAQHAAHRRLPAALLSRRIDLDRGDAHATNGSATSRRARIVDARPLRPDGRRLSSPCSDHRAARAGADLGRVGGRRATSVASAAPLPRPAPDAAVAESGQLLCGRAVPTGSGPRFRACR